MNKNILFGYLYIKHSNYNNLLYLLLKNNIRRHDLT